MICDKCGGNRTEEECKLCDLFASGVPYDGVEACRQNKPNLALGLKVAPEQVPQAIEEAKRLGVPTYYNPQGYPVFESRRHQALLCRKLGVGNRDGGWGDQ